MLKKSTLDKENIWLQKLTDVYIFLLITVFLLCFDSGGYTNIASVKFRAFCIFSGGYILLMLVLWLEMLITGLAKCPPVKTILKNSSWVQRLILCYALFTIISALLSPYGTSTLLGQSRYEGALTTVIYVMSFLLVSVFGNAKKWQVYVWAISISIFSILSIVQLLGYNPFTLYPAGYTYYDGNIAYSSTFISTIGNIDLAAIVLCISIPIFLYSIITFKEKKRFFLIIPFLLCVIVLLKINVAADIVAVFCGLVLTLPRTLKISPKRQKMLYITAFILGLLFVAVVYFKDFESTTLHELHEVLHGNLDDDFGSGRLYIWKEVLKVVPAHFWFGGGPDTLSSLVNSSFQRYDANLDMTIVAKIDTAHNEYLNILANQGIFALLSYLLAIFFALIKWERTKKSATIICGSAMICYLIQAFFSFSMCVTAPFFWLLFAMLEKECNKMQEGIHEKNS